MSLRRGALFAACGTIIGLAFGATNQASAQLTLPPARAPCSLLSGLPCHPSFCGAFHGGPCFPQYLPPIGQDLRLTVVSNDQNDPANRHDGDADKTSGEAGNADADSDHAVDDHALNSLSALYAALRACWVPPPRDEARHGMEYTVRLAFKRDGAIVAPPRRTYSSHDASAQVRDLYGNAVNAALARCTPLHFSKGMGGAVAGRPIAIRFVDDRSVDKAKADQ